MLLVKQLPRSRKEKQVMQGKEENESKLLPKACKMWMMYHLIRLMMKNQVQEVEDKYSAIWCLRTEFLNGLADHKNVSNWQNKTF